MALSKRLNERIWKDIEKRSTKEQRELLGWQLQAREPITKFSDIKVGDHLIKRSSVREKLLYYHHFLCIESDSEGRPTIIHYYNTAGNAFWQLFETCSFGSGLAFGQLASIKEVTLPHKDFIENESKLQEKGAEVERVVWPDELKRFPVEEVVRRARQRKDEKYYDIAQNNCESFVMWCLCDMNVSLQSTPWVLSLYEIAGGIIRTFVQSWQQVPKVVAERIEKSVENAIGKTIAESIAGLGSNLGVVFALLVEVCCAAYSIYEAKQKWNDGVLIKTRQDFIKEVADAVLLALCRLGASIGGMFLGQILPLNPLCLLGLLIGTLLGHFVGKRISGTCSNFIASTVEKCIQMAHSKQT